MRGFNDAVKEFKDVKLLASQPGNYQRLQALQVMENLMQSHRQIDVVLAANDAMAIGAIEALDGANRTAKVTGINATKEGIEAIKSGKMLASGDVDPFAQGCLGTFAAIRALRNEPIVSEVILQPVVVNLTNHKTYDVTVESRTCPSWEQSAAATKKN